MICLTHPCPPLCRDCPVPGFSPSVFLVGSHAAFGPIDGSLGLGLFGCTITKEKLIKTIQKVFAADPDLSFILQLSEFKLAMLVATIRERIDRR